MKITYQEPLNKHKLQSLTCRKLSHIGGFISVLENSESKVIGTPCALPQAIVPRAKPRFPRGAMVTNKMKQMYLVILRGITSPP